MSRTVHFFVFMALAILCTSLRYVVGCGLSPLIEYSGAGVYFPEKSGHGVWPMEVMPDVAEADDSFKKNVIEKAGSCY